MHVILYVNKFKRQKTVFAFGLNKLSQLLND